MSLPLLDTNILLRHLLRDNDTQSPKATALVSSVEQKQARVRITDAVIFETVYTLTRSYKRSKSEIKEAVLPIIVIKK